MEQSTSIAPLVVFRIAFGLLMLFSSSRYLYMGWLENQLTDPILHFSYYGFDWIKPISETGMYMIFIIMMIASIFISLGFVYRISTIVFFLCFTYIELIDITYYLNHYYFVSLVALMLIFVPANKHFSLDVKLGLTQSIDKIPSWCIGVFKWQIAIVYIYAGLAKMNYAWLIEALPLRIWLPAQSELPIIGFMFEYDITPYLFSWAGMLFDTFIIFGLMYKKTRLISYLCVVFFHSITGILFQIGVFPIVMMFGVLIFFSDEFHQKIIAGLRKLIGFGMLSSKNTDLYSYKTPKFFKTAVFLFFVFQILFPWRFMLYSGNLFWTEQGYRFGWRVMLMEKAGTATFFVKDGENGREGSVINHQFLNMHQEKQMAMQPDLILQFAHYLEEHFKEKGMKDPKVRVEAWVTLNGKPAQLLIDPSVDLTEKKDTWQSKDWILPFKASNAKI